MLGNFEDLEKDIDKFHDNVLASGQLIDSLNAVTEALEKQSKEITEHTYAVKKATSGIPSDIRQSLKEYKSALSDENNEYLKRSVASFSEQQQAYINQLLSSQAELEACRRKLSDAPDQLKQMLRDSITELERKNDEYLKRSVASYSEQQQGYIDQLLINQAQLEACKRELSSAPDQLKQILQDSIQELERKNEEYLKECSSAFVTKQDEYISQLTATQEKLDASQKKITETQQVYLQKVQEFDIEGLKGAVESVKSDLSKKVNILTIITVLACAASVIGIFIK